MDQVYATSVISQSLALPSLGLSAIGGDPTYVDVFSFIAPEIKLDRMLWTVESPSSAYQQGVLKLSLVQDMTEGRVEIIVSDQTVDPREETSIVDADGVLLQYGRPTYLRLKTAAQASGAPPWYLSSGCKLHVSLHFLLVDLAAAPRPARAQVPALWEGS